MDLKAIDELQWTRLRYEKAKAMYERYARLWELVPVETQALCRTGQEPSPCERTGLYPLAWEIQKQWLYWGDRMEAAWDQLQENHQELKEDAA